jgi:acid phosphatase
MLFSQALAVALSAVPLVTSYQSHTSSYLKRQFSQNFYDGYNILKHVGGIGPYSDRVSYGIDRNPPAGCAVDQVLMLMRHAERYPDTSTAAVTQAGLQKLYSSGVKTWSGDLFFLEQLVKLPIRFGPAAAGDFFWTLLGTFTRLQERLGIP